MHHLGPSALLGSRSMDLLVAVSVLVAAMMAQAVTPERSSGLFGFTGTNDSVLTTATVQPPASAGTANPQQTELDVSWTASPTAGVTGYQVYRSGASGGPYAALGGVLGAGTLGITDSGLDPATDYFYVVQAIAGGWVSANSMEATGTTLQ